MEDIINDFKSENFTLREMVVYGIVYPLGMIAACLVADLLNAL